MPVHINSFNRCSKRQRFLTMVLKRKSSYQKKVHKYNFNNEKNNVIDVEEMRMCKTILKILILR